MRRCHGFTVVEAVVSLALTSVFLLIVSQLVHDTHVASLATRRQALDPTPQHLAHSLRNDVHRARRVDVGSGWFAGSWSYGALDLVFPEGGGVRYERSAGVIRRTLVDVDGAPSGDRALMRDVLSFRWLRLAPDLVELEIVFRRRPIGEGLSSSWRDQGAALETSRMRLAMRSVPGRRSW